jgi:hypothetical protein
VAVAKWWATVPGTRTGMMSRPAGLLWTLYSEIVDQWLLETGKLRSKYINF